MFGVKGLGSKGVGMVVLLLVGDLSLCNVKVLCSFGGLLVINH